MLSTFKHSSKKSPANRQFRGIGLQSRRKKTQRRKLMTVCTAALCHGGKDAVGTYDCMVTYGGLQFEAPEHKAIPVDKGILVLTAGDGDLQNEILTRHKALISHKKQSLQENESVTVAMAANLYQEAYVATWQDKAERKILSKQNLTYQTYLDKQKKLTDRNVSDLAEKLARFRLPDIEAIIVGVDDSGAHLYIFHYDDITEDYDLKCRDSSGYACIGSGAALAEAVFIINRYTPNCPLTDALFTSYVAKKRAELADGVGIQTRIFKIIPEELNFLWSKPYFNKLIQKTYTDMADKIAAIQSEARKHISKEVQNVVEDIKNEIKAKTKNVKKEGDNSDSNQSK